jgi:uncharacterized protein YcaQ
MRTNREHEIVPAEHARRLLMHAQGLSRDPAKRTGPRDLYRLIEQMGFVQLDTINVLDRAHHLTLHTRLDGYRRRHLAKLAERDRLLFEHMTHDASFIPTAWFRFWKPRFARSYDHPWWRDRMGEHFEEVRDHVLERIRHEGPLMSRDFEQPGQTEAWWGWKPAKAALEYLWRTGELAVARRINFQKVYDLTARILPEAHAEPQPEHEELVEFACRSALERLVIATHAEVAQFWNAIKTPEAARWCKAAVARGELEIVSVDPADDGKPRPAFALPDWRDRLKRCPEPPSRVRLLCPFDPVIRDRKRLRRLFNFDYRFEAFTPAAKRIHGYFVLPILQGDRFIGRLDPKFHRERGELEIRALHWEAGRPARDQERGLDEAIDRLAAFVGADTWSITT